MSEQDTGPDCQASLARIGKGVVQANLRLNRALELLESSPSVSPPDGGDPGGPDASPRELLDILFDALEALHASAHEEDGNSGSPAAWWAVWRRAEPPKPTGPRPGPSLAHAAAVDRLRTQRIVPTAEHGAFDARVHEAIERVPTDRRELDGTLHRTHRQGWQHQRNGESVVLRRALVGVHHFEAPSR